MWSTPNRRHLLRLLAAAAALPLGGCLPPYAPRPFETVQGVDFTDRNDTLVFDFCFEPGNCVPATYNFVTGEAFVYGRPPGQNWVSPAFSSDGSTIAFVAYLPSPVHGYLDRLDAQITTMRADGSGLRVIRNGPGARGGPIFAPDGKRIVFLKSTRMAPLDPRRPIGFDLFELSLASWNEKRLTFNEFRWLAPEGYDRAGRLWAYAEAPRYIDEGGQRIEQEQRVGGTRVWRFDPTTKQIERIDLGTDPEDPKLSGFAVNDLALISARTNARDGLKGFYAYDLFLLRDGQLTRLTETRSYIAGAALSRDGSRAFLESRPRGEWTNPLRRLIVDTATGELRDIAIPEAIEAYRRIPVTWDAPA